MPIILVVGDVMLDRYWFGDVTRLSQEAPVPVVRMEREDCRAGAAANVAMNVAALGGRASLIGVIGADESGAILGGLLKGVVTSTLIVNIGFSTTTKLRVIGRNQQIVRIDQEQRPDLCVDAPAKLYARDSDILVVSDYDKGAFLNVGKVIDEAKGLGKTVIVDPKGYDYSKYAGADLVKPNLDEMRSMLGGWRDEIELADKTHSLRQLARIGAVLLTRGAGGMTLYDDRGGRSIPAAAKEVYDVTGAGDTVMAALAVMLSRGKSLLEAATIANYAAGVTVGKFGTAVCTAQELEGAMRGTGRGDQEG